MKQIFINLPVESIELSMRFYSRIGFSIKPVFSDNFQKCMVWSEHIYVMLISKEKYSEYSKKSIPKVGSTSTYFTLLVEDFQQVNKIVDEAIKAGGYEQYPRIDEGFMQIRKFEDLDGHLWHITFLDLSKFLQEKN